MPGRDLYSQGFIPFSGTLSLRYTDRSIQMASSSSEYA